MRTKKVYITLMLIVIIILTLISACSSVKDKQDSNNYIPATEQKSNSTDVSTPKPVVNIDKETAEVVATFIKSINGKNKDLFKQIISPSGLVVIRNFSSGYGNRGNDIRDIYSANNIPVNLEFTVDREEPIALNELFKKSQQIEVQNIPLEKVVGYNFNFKDSSKNSIYGPSTEDVRSVTERITSSKDVNGQYSPKLFNLAEKEIVLTESALAADIPVGAWAVFEKSDSKIYLRAIIDLR